MEENTTSRTCHRDRCVQHVCTERQFIEQGSSTSKMTVLKVLDVTSRRPGCAGQACDTVAASSYIKIKDAPRLLEHPDSECPTIGIRQPRSRRLQLLNKIQDPVGTDWKASVRTPISITAVGARIRRGLDRKWEYFFNAPSARTNFYPCM